MMKLYCAKKESSILFKRTFAVSLALILFLTVLFANGVFFANAESSNSEKMLHITTESWGEYGTGFLSTNNYKNKTLRLSYYFKGEGGSGDYSMRVMYWANNWSQSGLVQYTKNITDDKTGLTTTEFVLPAAAHNFKIFVNEGYSAGANIWLYDVRFVDVENPDVNLQANWLTAWKGKDGGKDTSEVVDVDMTKFAAIDYTNKMLHLVSRVWGEHGTNISANNLRGKNMRLTYYFKGEGGNGDYDFRVWYIENNDWSAQKSVKFTKNEIDKETGMCTREFTVPNTADVLRIFVNEGSAAGADIWVYDVKFVDVNSPDNNLQKDWLEKWTGNGNKELVDADVTIFKPVDYTNKMLHLVSREWGEHGTNISANNLRGKNMRLTYYFKGQGGNEDYDFRVWYIENNDWSAQKSVKFTKNEIDKETGMCTREFAVPSTADVLRIFVNEGSAAGADIWVYDVNFADVNNPNNNLQKDWLEKWTGNGGAEIVNADVTIFKPVDYTNKMLHLTSTGEWKEFGGYYSVETGKTYEFTYYYKYITENSDNVADLRIEQSNVSVKRTDIVDENYEKTVSRFTVPQTVNGPATVQIRIYLNEGMLVGTEMWLYVEGLVDVSDRSTNLAEDWYIKWNGAGDKEYIEFDKDFFKKENATKLAHSMLTVPAKTNVEYGTSAQLFPNGTYRFSTYYSDDAENAVKIYYKNNNGEFKEIPFSCAREEGMYHIYDYDFTVPNDAKTDKDGKAEVSVRIVPDTQNTTYCYNLKLTEKDDTNNLIRDPGEKHNFIDWNSYLSGTDTVCNEMLDLIFEGFDCGLFISPSYKTMIKADAIYWMATFGTAPNLEIGKTYEFSMYCNGVKSSRFSIFYYDDQYRWRSLLPDSEENSETELFTTYKFIVPDDALNNNGKTAIHLRFTSGLQNSENYLYKVSLYEESNKTVNLINDPSLSHSFKGWYVINTESPGFSTGGAVNGMTLVPLDMDTFVDDTSDRPYDDGNWISKFGMKPYLLGAENDIDDNDFYDYFDDFYEEEIIDDDFDDNDVTVTSNPGRRRKKVIVITEYYTWVYIVIAIAAVVVIGGGVTAFILIKHKRNKKKSV